MGSITAVFVKMHDMKYISHLDLMRLFQRALRRAMLPATVTRGFSPRIKMSLNRALKLGLESDCEGARFYLDADVEPAGFMSAMNETLPEGVKIIKAEKA
ncbi:MAG: TIGR03936 family radical SAM-associated protein [Candidatus Omnitrophota bacterium]